MKKTVSNLCFLSLLLVFTVFLCSCGTSQEKLNDSERSTEEAQHIIEQLEAEIESQKQQIEVLSAKVEELQNTLSEYQALDSIKNALDEGDYNKAIGLIVEMIPTDSNKVEVDTDDPVESSLIGTWVSQRDSSQTFKLDKGGLAYIGDMLCTWKVASNSYGAYGVLIYVDNGAGRYELLLTDNPNELVSNSYTSNMPEYLDFSSTTFLKQ